MPVAEGDVIGLQTGETVEVEQVGDAVRIFGIGEVEALDGTVGENDPGTIRREGGGEGRILQPVEDIAGILAAEERAGENHGFGTDLGFTFPKDVKVRRGLASDAGEEGLDPDGAGAVVIVVAGNHVDGELDAGDGGTGGGDGRLVDGVGVEEVAGDKDEGAVLFAGSGTERIHGLDAFVAKARHATFIRDRRE